MAKVKHTKQLISYYPICPSLRKSLLRTRVLILYFKLSFTQVQASVAQLAGALGCQPTGWWFEPTRGRCLFLIIQKSKYKKKKNR